MPNIESFLRIDAHDIHCKLHEPALICIFISRFILKMIHKHTELRIIQMISVRRDLIEIETFNQRIFTCIGCTVKATAIHQIIQDLEIGGAMKQRLVFFRIIADILNQILLPRLKRAFDNCSAENGIYIDIQLCAA